MNTLFLYDDDRTTKNIAKIMASVVSMSRYAAYTDTSVAIEKYNRVVLVVGPKHTLCAHLKQFSQGLAKKWVGLIVTDFQNTRYEVRVQDVEIQLQRKLDFETFVSQEQYVDDAIEGAEKLCAATTPENAQDPDVLKVMEDFLDKHNTGVLATGWGRHVRATPIEYVYEHGHLYIFSEGCGKFAHLYRNDQVSFAIFEPFKDFQHLAGLQLYGKARIIEPEEDEYATIAKTRRIPVEKLRAMPVMLHIIDITLTNAVFLWAGFTKQGKGPRQVYEF